MSLEIRDNLTEVVEMINEVEWVRKQIYDLDDLLSGQDAFASVTDAGKELDVGDGRGPGFAALRVDPEHRVVSGSDFRIPVSQQECIVALAVVDLELFRHQFQGVFDARSAEANDPLVVVDGKPMLRSYGSMTYAGFKSMLYAGLSADDPRVQAAAGWISKHYDVKSNPGMQDAGLGSVLATSHLGQGGAVPSAFYTALCVFTATAALLAAALYLKDPVEKALGIADNVPFGAQF